MGECFSKHHLLRADCECSCLGDDSNSCSECNECRWFWKAPMQGELAQSVTAGYDGPVLPGAGNLVPYEYSMFYVLPHGVRTRNGVLRWHYMTTNSCTSKPSAPEEFWNCADVAVTDESGDMGPEVHYDNTALRNLEVLNLMPEIGAGTLSGVNHACPEDSQGNLKGVGAKNEYHRRTLLRLQRRLRSVACAMGAWQTMGCVTPSPRDSVTSTLSTHGAARVVSPGT